MKKVLVTGSAGFIGFHLVKALLQKECVVVGVDNLNDYYDPQLKRDRLDDIDHFIDENRLDNNYQFLKLDISNRVEMHNLFEENSFQYL